VKTGVLSPIDLSIRIDGFGPLFDVDKKGFVPTS
jgi:hypothetical protein